MSKMNLIDSEEERQFCSDIHEILKNAKNTAYAAVNDIMTYAYWDIGERIVEQEQKGIYIKSGYYKRILSTQFPDKAG